MTKAIDFEKGPGDLYDPDDAFDEPWLTDAELDEENLYDTMPLYDFSEWVELVEMVEGQVA